MIDSQFIPNLVVSINIKMGHLLKVISQLFIKSYIFKNHGGSESRNTTPISFTYLRNKPTNTNNATSPAKPDSPNVFMMDVRLPITLTPKMPDAEYYFGYSTYGNKG